MTPRSSIALLGDRGKPYATCTPINGQIADNRSITLTAQSMISDAYMLWFHVTFGAHDAYLNVVRPILWSLRCWCSVLYHFRIISHYSSIQVLHQSYFEAVRWLSFHPYVHRCDTVLWWNCFSVPSSIYHCNNAARRWDTNNWASPAYTVNWLAQAEINLHRKVWTRCFV